MRNDDFEDVEDFIDIIIDKGYVDDDDYHAVNDKLDDDDVSFSEVKSYVNARLAEKKKNDKLAAEEEARMAKQASSGPKSGKRGIVQTCPNCGATVQAGNAKCPECGYAFAGVDAVSSAQELDRRLRKITGTGESADKQRATIVSSFPIPNSREDLIEFLAALEPKAFSSNGSKALTKVYLEKFTECLNKAKLSFPDDPATKMFIEKESSHKKKRHIIFGAIGIIVLALIAWIGIAISNNNRAAESLAQEYKEWKAKSLVEIESYSLELNAQLDEIPAPNPQNWETCANKWSKVTWNKIWVEGKYRDLLREEGCYKGLDDRAFKAFVNKKNQIGESIGEAQRRYLESQGDKHAASHTTWFHESELR